MKKIHCLAIISGKYFCNPRGLTKKTWVFILFFEKWQGLDGMKCYSALVYYLAILSFRDSSTFLYDVVFIVNRLFAIKPSQIVELIKIAFPRFIWHKIRTNTYRTLIFKTSDIKSRFNIWIFFVDKYNFIWVI